MRRVGRGVIFATGAATMALGCFLVTGGTGGYTLAPPEAGVCSYDASALGVTLSCACASKSDCDAGTPFCCFGLGTGTSSSTIAAGSTCEKHACDAATTVQLCHQNSECVDAACIKQTCSYGEVPVPVQACGMLPNCTP